MSMLMDKREELSKKLDNLLNKRLADINEKVNAYKEQLVAEPLSEEIINTKKVIDALDEVIKFEAIIVSPVEAAKPESVEEIDVKEPEVIVPEEIPEAIPEVIIPEVENSEAEVIESKEDEVINAEPITEEVINEPETIEVIPEVVPEVVPEVTQEIIQPIEGIQPIIVEVSKEVEARPGMSGIEIPNRG